MNLSIIWGRQRGGGEGGGGVEGEESLGVVCRKFR